MAAAVFGVEMSGQQAGAEQRREESSAPTSSPSRFVLGLDVGSTVIRCHVYDRTARVRGSSAQKVTRLGGWVWGSDCTVALPAPLGARAGVAGCLSLASCPAGLRALALPGWNRGDCRGSMGRLRVCGQKVVCDLPGFSALPHRPFSSSDFDGM